MRKYQIGISKRSKPSKPVVAPMKRLVPVDMRTPAGQVLLAVGDIVRISRETFIVEMVNLSRARLLPTSTRDVHYTTTGGKEVDFTTTGRSISISPNIEQSMIVERLGENGFRNYFTRKAATREAANEAAKTKNETKGNTVKKTNATATATDGWPANDFDRANWEEILKGGTNLEIANRVAARFSNEPDPANKKYRTNPANSLKWHDGYVTEMKEVGLLDKAGKAIKGASPKTAPSAPEAAPKPVSAPKTPASKKDAPAGRPDPKAAKRVEKPAGKSKVIQKVGPATPVKAPKPAKAAKPVKAPRGGLYADKLAEDKRAKQDAQAAAAAEVPASDEAPL